MMWGPHFKICAFFATLVLPGDNIVGYNCACGVFLFYLPSNSNQLEISLSSMAAKMWHKLFTTKSKKNRTTPSTATTSKKSTFSNVIKSLSLSTSKVNCSDADKRIAGIYFCSNVFLFCLAPFYVKEETMNGN